MYPFLRMFWQLFKYRNAAPLPVWAEHRSTHYCMPWDLDLWLELNNGRTLTLYDLGRIPMARRTGLMAMLKRQGWGITVAGSTVRYRQRIRALEKVEMRSRAVGCDARFVYIEQSMWKANGVCANHILMRMAVTGPNGIVPTQETLPLLGAKESDIPPLPAWAQAWSDLEAQRPWPPMQDEL